METLDVSDNNTEAAADRVAEWMASTGGLYVPDEGPEHPLAAELAAAETRVGSVRV